MQVLALFQYLDLVHKVVVIWRWSPCHYYIMIPCLIQCSIIRYCVHRSLVGSPSQMRVMRKMSMEVKWQDTYYSGSLWFSYPYSSSRLHWWWDNRNVIPGSMKYFLKDIGNRKIPSHSIEWETLWIFLDLYYIWTWIGTGVCGFCELTATMNRWLGERKT